MADEMDADRARIALNAPVLSIVDEIVEYRHQDGLRNVACHPTLLGTRLRDFAACHDRGNPTKSVNRISPIRVQSKSLTLFFQISTCNDQREREKGEGGRTKTPQSSTLA